MIDRGKLESIVREAGRLALAGWPGDGHALRHWEKTPGSPVCDADLAVDAFLKKELSALLPSAGWLSEETADAPDRLREQLVWLVDPIDGTRDFIAGRTGWAVSVALVNTRRPLFGYLYAPARRREDGGEFWQAEAGKGSWRNGTRLAASVRDSLPGARVPAKKLASEDADLTLVEQPNSIALRMAMVAADEADLLASLRWGFEWDIAAAGLIAREAGATVTDAFGKALNYNKHDPRAFGVLVTSSAIHADAVTRLADRARRFSA
ncbi:MULTISPECIES: 3'(2'),5'-bisphosphate nucleotidase CysQ [Novosphingobium]|uniref:Myo-inositol-1(Or 4)-monophosphatase n=1 Tax=Novosphingobium mathurense TaxID=428990 RepID=A0A1U6HCC7_9SPHN|nr:MULTISPECIES: 3'(2'),5'-bisphosphate nucleotidase CysQ [Novosphingobium]CDO34635.1 Inositol monophosphatase family protein [Novosphingobium sp. KN65.2]SLJ93428.1 myo-inositol-1(or 4)-monophosphatase [Novosphingobium mathurense]